MENLFKNLRPKELIVVGYCKVLITDVLLLKSPFI